MRGERDGERGEGFVHLGGVRAGGVDDGGVHLRPRRSELLLLFPSEWGMLFLFFEREEAGGGIELAFFGGGQIVRAEIRRLAVHRDSGDCTQIETNPPSDSVVFFPFSNDVELL